MQPSKWDLVLGSRPVPVVEHVLDEAAKLFAKDLAVWPPAVESFDATTGAALGELLAGHPPAPDTKLYAEAFRLTLLDLERDLDAYDEYFRNQRYTEAGLSRGDRPMLLFISRFMTEQLLGLGEATDGRLSRPRLIEVLDRTRRHFFAHGGGSRAGSPL
jgi:hypothetical protein